MGTKTVKHFTDLTTWKYAHALVLALYEITQTFPTEERFGLTNQMRRAAISVPSNIAEGFARRSVKEKRTFYYTAKASLAEVHSQLLIARDLRYTSDDDYVTLAERITMVDKLIAGLVKSTTYRTTR